MRLGIKAYLVFVLTVFIRSSVQAQVKEPGFVVGAYAMGADPKGGFNRSYSFGGGVEAFGGVGLDNTFLIATLGYSAFFARSGTHAGLISYVPVKLGVRQYFLRHHLFINGDIGIANIKNKGTNNSRFTRGAGAGVNLLGVEFALYYDGFKNSGSGFSNSLYGKFGYSFSL